MSTSLESFTRTLLTRHGAVVEATGNGLDVITDPALAHALGLSEYARLVFTTREHTISETHVDYDAPLVERMGALVGGLGRVGVVSCDVPPPRPIDAAAEVERRITLLNGVARVREVEPAVALRLGVFMEYELLADVREGGLLCTWITPDTRSVPRMAGWPDLGRAPDLDAPVLSADGPDSAVSVPWTIALASARVSLTATVDGFLESLTRRRDRDARRLREYSIEIDRAIRAKLLRPGASDPVRRRERDRLEATWQSYRSRLADLADRYRLRVRLVPIGVVACLVPGYRIRVRLMRRTTTSEVVFAWNAIDGRLETRGCDGCDTPTPQAWLCDDRVHYLCDACFAACAQCGKPFCRACHRACPRKTCAIRT